MRADGGRRGLDRDHVLGRDLGGVSRIGATLGSVGTVARDDGVTLDPRDVAGRRARRPRSARLRPSAPSATPRASTAPAASDGNGRQDRRGRARSDRSDADGARAARTRRSRRRSGCATRPRRRSPSSIRRSASAAQLVLLSARRSAARDVVGRGRAAAPAANPSDRDDAHRRHGTIGGSAVSTAARLRASSDGPEAERVATRADGRRIGRVGARDLVVGDAQRHAPPPARRGRRVARARTRGAARRRRDRGATAARPRRRSGAGAARRSSLIPTSPWARLAPFAAEAPSGERGRAPARSGPAPRTRATRPPRACRLDEHDGGRTQVKDAELLAASDAQRRVEGVDRRAGRRARRLPMVVIRPTIIATTMTTVTRPRPPSASISMATRRLRQKRLSTWRMPIGVDRDSSRRASTGCGGSCPPTGECTRW